MLQRSARILLFVSLLFLGACANPAPPPGGPPDKTPPEILRTEPANATTSFRGGSVRVEFSEWLRREGFSESVYITPPVEYELSWSGRELEIEFNEDLAPNTTYALSIATDYTDLKGNRPAQAFTLIFSTGTRLDSGRIGGSIFDSKPEGVFVFLYPLAGIDADTLNPAHTPPRYRTQVGTNGTFEFQALPPGDYRLIALRDEFRNLLYDAGEDAFGAPPADLSIGEGGSARTAMRIAPPEDRRAPLLYGAQALHNRRISARFNEPLAPYSLRTEQVDIRDSAGQLAPPRILALHRASNDSMALDIYTEQPLANDIRWHLRLHDVRDTAGNVLSDTANSVYFSSTGRRDSLPPVLQSVSIADSSTGIGLDREIRLVFSGALDTAGVRTALNILPVQAGLPALEVLPGAPNQLRLAAPALLAGDTWYGFRLELGRLRDVYGTPLADSSIERNFKTLDPRNLGGLSGTLEDTSGIGGPFLLIAESTDGKQRYRLRLPEAGSWEIQEMLPGTYRLGIFADENDNGRYDYGMAYPFQGGERYHRFAGEVKVAARWTTQDVRIRYP